MAFSAALTFHAIVPMFSNLIVTQAINSRARHVNHIALTVNSGDSLNPSYLYSHFPDTAPNHANPGNNIILPLIPMEDAGLVKPPLDLFPCNRIPDNHDYVTLELTNPCCAVVDIILVMDLLNV